MAVLKRDLDRPDTKGEGREGSEWHGLEHRGQVVHDKLAMQNSEKETVHTSWRTSKMLSGSASCL